MVTVAICCTVDDGVVGVITEPRPSPELIRARSGDQLRLGRRHQSSQSRNCKCLNSSKFNSTVRD